MLSWRMTPGAGTHPYQLGPVALSWWLNITKLKPNSCRALSSAHAPAFLLYLDRDLFIFPPHAGWEGDGAEPGLVMLPPACWQRGEDPAAPAGLKSVFPRMISYPDILLGLQLHPHVPLALFCIPFLLSQPGLEHLAAVGHPLFPHQLSPPPHPMGCILLLGCSCPSEQFCCDK